MVEVDKPLLASIVSVSRRRMDSAVVFKDSWCAITSPVGSHVLEDGLQLPRRDLVAIVHCCYPAPWSTILCPFKSMQI